MKTSRFSAIIGILVLVIMASGCKFSANEPFRIDLGGKTYSGQQVAGLGVAVVSEQKVEYIINPFIQTQAKILAASGQTMGGDLPDPQFYGTFRIVKFVIANLGNKSVKIWGTKIKLVDQYGHQHGISMQAQQLRGDLNLLKELSPGNNITFDLAFHVPRDVKIEKIILNPDGVAKLTWLFWLPAEYAVTSL